MTRKQRRFAFLAGGLAVLGLASALVLFALSDTIVFFYGPKDAISRLDSGELQPGQRIRLGGLVKEGSVARASDGPVRFVVSDGESEVTVAYAGLLPDLFREGQGIVAQGSFADDRSFVANEVLAKHDETYMPPEVAETLKKNGQWKHADPEGAKAPAPAYGAPGA